MRGRLVLVLAWVALASLAAAAEEGVPVEGGVIRLQLPGDSPEAAEHWAHVASTIGVPFAHLRRMRQVHGCTTVVAAPATAATNAAAPITTADTTATAAAPAPVESPQADGVMTDERGVALVVQVADCVPLLMADPRTGAVAAVHAGWRGTAARVTVAAIEEMQRQFGTEAADLMVAIGPAIGPCCYEVGSDLVDAFAAAGHERYLIDRWFMTPREQRMRLDVVGANRDQLILAGVREENVHACGLCTAMHLDVLTSYRAEKSAAGRIAGAIRASAPTTGVSG